MLKTDNAIQANVSIKEFNLTFRNYRPKCKKLENFVKENKSIVQSIERNLNQEMLDAINSFIEKVICFQTKLSIVLLVPLHFACTKQSGSFNPT
jgi:hypothetical protein